MTRAHPQKAGRSRDRGAGAITALVLLVAVGAFFALALNVGILMGTRTELQSAVDSAALAAARSLNGQADGLDEARTAAADFLTDHKAFGESLLFDVGNDLEFGRWHLDGADCTFGGGSSCFESIATSVPRQITAVRIKTGRDGGAHAPPVTLPFGAFIGKSTSSVLAEAVAAGGGAAAVDCSLPFAVAECVIIPPTASGVCDGSGTPQRLDFSNANDDGIGFINLFYPGESQAPGPPFVEDVIRNRLCASDQHQIGDGKLQDGNSLNDNILDALRGITRHGHTETVDPDGCLVGTVQTIAVTDAGCPTNPIFHGAQEVVGFVKARLIAVTDNHGTALGCPSDAEPPVVDPPAPNRSVTLEVLCDAPAGDGEWGGGRAYQSSDVPVRLVD